jgi:long-chain acyl-CoA synthetase
VDYLPEVKPSVMMNVPTLFNRVYSRVMETRGQMTGIKAFLFDKALHYGKEMIPYIVDDRENEVPFSTYLPYTILNHLVLDKIRERFGGNLKYATCGGAGCPREVLDFMWAIGIPVLEGYGLTETSPMNTVNVFEKGGRLKLGTVGSPLSNVEILIGDPNEEGEGEILVRGPHVMQGYHNLPQETKDAFITLNGKKYFRTGDLGRIITEKRMVENKERMVDFLKVTGRVKEQYKLENGKYVVPAPLEDKIQLSTFIAQAVLYGDNKESNIVMLVLDEITLRNWRESRGLQGSFNFQEELEKEDVVELTRHELKKVLSYLPSYARPKRFFFIPYLLTPDNEFATPKLSIKRPRVFKHFKQEIEDCYSGRVGFDI